MRPDCPSTTADMSAARRSRQSARSPRRRGRRRRRSSATWVLCELMRASAARMAGIAHDDLVRCVARRERQSARRCSRLVGLPDAPAKRFLIEHAAVLGNAACGLPHVDGSSTPRTSPMLPFGALLRGQYQICRGACQPRRRSGAVSGYARNAHFSCSAERRLLRRRLLLAPVPPARFCMLFGRLGVRVGACGGTSR
jgi:hypothetical protein